MVGGLRGHGQPADVGGDGIPDGPARRKRGSLGYAKKEGEGSLGGNDEAEVTSEDPWSDRPGGRATNKPAKAGPAATLHTMSMEFRGDVRFS